MGKTKSKQYNKFVKEGVIETLTPNHLETVMKKVNGIYGKYITEGRALVTILFYTGCRPAEALEIKAKDIIRYNTRMIGVRIVGKKRGYPRTVLLKLNLPFVKEFWKYSQSMFDELPLFEHYKGRYIRNIKKGNKIEQRIDTTDKFRYHFKKWFRGILGDNIVPYFLRHNRFSLLAEAGATDRQLKQLKGSRSDSSIEYYVHMSTKSAVEMAKMIK